MFQEAKSDQVKGLTSVTTLRNKKEDVYIPPVTFGEEFSWMMQGVIHQGVITLVTGFVLVNTKYVARESNLIAVDTWIHELVFMQECVEAGSSRWWDQTPMQGLEVK
jgi:hypothetical protein